MSDIRLMYIIGFLKRFFSFDPNFKLCQICRYRIMRREVQDMRDGGARKTMSFLCNKCEL